jgi:hypothetical protein
MTNRKEAAFIQYAAATPPVATTMPAADGPATAATWNMMVFRLMAFARCSRGTRFGMSAWRAGPSKAPAAELSAATR